MNIKENDDLALTITWDPANALNLAVTDVRDAKSKSGKFLMRFIKRYNVFNHVLANGKGFAFLGIVDSNAKKTCILCTRTIFQFFIRTVDQK